MISREKKKFIESIYYIYILFLILVSILQIECNSSSIHYAMDGSIYNDDPDNIIAIPIYGANNPITVSAPESIIKARNGKKPKSKTLYRQSLNTNVTETIPLTETRSQITQFIQTISTPMARISQVYPVQMNTPAHLQLSAYRPPCGIPVPIVAYSPCRSNGQSSVYPFYYSTPVSNIVYRPPSMAAMDVLKNMISSILGPKILSTSITTYWTATIPKSAWKTVTSTVSTTIHVTYPASTLTVTLPCTTILTTIIIPNTSILSAATGIANIPSATIQVPSNIMSISTIPTTITSISTIISYAMITVAT